GIGVGAVSTIESRRWRNTPRLARYLAALGRGERPERELEPLEGDVRLRERVMLGLRLDEPLDLDAELAATLDADALVRMERLGVDRPRRARRARGARPAHASAHLSRPDPDRDRLPRLRRRAARARRAGAARRVPARPDRRAARDRGGASGDDGNALAGQPP